MFPDQIPYEGRKNDDPIIGKLGAVRNSRQWEKGRGAVGVMTPEEMQVIFEGGFELVIVCYMIGLGMGMIFKIIRMAMDR